MISNIQILLAIATAATSTFLQTPSNQLESTLLTPNDRLFMPIIIPNITKATEPHQKAAEEAIKSILHPEDSSQESTTTDEESKAVGNSHKFSSRYSTKNDSSKEGIKTTEYPTADSSEKEEIPKLISNRSDDFDSEEDEKESEELESTTAVSHREDIRETTTAEEDKRSVDYYNSGSKNYHSIQTPLDRIKYQGPHSFTDDRERIVAPIIRRPATHKWPQIKTDLENINEIPESEENYEKELDEGISEEVRTPKLESAEEKDRQKFDRSKKYNYIELRNLRKQQQKALIAEEEKDDSKPLFQSLRQYQVEEEATRQPIFSFKSWSTNHPPGATPTDVKTNFNKPNFQGHQFLGPVVFNHKPKQSTLVKGLIQNEKLDQEKLTNERREKSVFRTGNKDTQSFNHLKESDDMYNAILANIQSVFGLRTQPLKSSTRNGRGFPEVNLDESRAFTWSLPLKKTNRDS